MKTIFLRRTHRKEKPRLGWSAYSEGADLKFWNQKVGKKTTKNPPSIFNSKCILHPRGNSALIHFLESEGRKKKGALLADENERKGWSNSSSCSQGILGKPERKKPAAFCPRKKGSSAVHSRPGGEWGKRGFLV